MQELGEVTLMGAMQAQAGIPTEELCQSGEHTMKLINIEDALTQHLHHGGVACHQCNFLLERGQSERIFVCVMCRSGQRTIRLKHTHETTFDRGHIFCETCVATGAIQKKELKKNWATGLFQCQGEMNHFLDALFCFPCKMGRIAHWVQFKYHVDGEIHGAGAQGSNDSVECCIARHVAVLLVSLTCMDLGLGFALTGEFANSQVRSHNGLASDESCCCWSYLLCPPCTVARWQREIKIHRGEEVPGCLAGPKWSDLKPHQRPANVTYTKLAPPAAPAVMGTTLGQLMNSDGPSILDNTWSANLPPGVVPKEEKKEAVSEFCTQCGKGFDAGDRFCAACGVKRS